MPSSSVRQDDANAASNKVNESQSEISFVDVAKPSTAPTAPSANPSLGVAPPAAAAQPAAAPVVVSHDPIADPASTKFVINNEVVPADIETTRTIIPVQFLIDRG